MLDTFKKFPSDRLQGYIVWLPMIKGDTAFSAAEWTEKEPRLTKGWNKDREIGDAFSQTLGLQRTAWDVYLVYKPGEQWTDGVPPAPAFWMHQLSRGADPSKHLDPNKFQADIQKLIENRSLGTP